MTGPLKHWSHSTIKGLLENCRHQWWLEKVVGLDNPTGTDAARGIAYHGGIELHEQARRDWRYSGGRYGSPEGVPREVMLAASFAQLDGLVVGTGDRAGSDRIDIDKARAAIQAAVDHWWDSPIPDGQPGAGGTLRDRVMRWAPIAVEREFRLWNDPDVTTLPTKGFPDVVYLDDTDGRTIVVVDHKSATSHGRYPHDGEGLTPQKAMYLRAIRKASGLPGLSSWPARFEFHIARVTTGSRSTFEGVRVVSLDEEPWDGAVLDGRYRLAGQAYEQGLESGWWPKNPGWNLCRPKFCAYHKDAGGPCDPHSDVPAATV